MYTNIYKRFDRKLQVGKYLMTINCAAGVNRVKNQLPNTYAIIPTGTRVATAPTTKQSPGHSRNEIGYKPLYIAVPNIPLKD